MREEATFIENDVPLMSADRITGSVESRSGGKRGLRAPSEAEILELNPGRAGRIRTAMEWDRVEPGSLNLHVDEEQIREVLASRDPALVEEPDDVVYPPGRCEHVPRKRGGYLYYSGSVAHHGVKIEVLLRRPVNPIRCRAELFAPISLRDHLRLKDGESIEVLMD